MRIFLRFNFERKSVRSMVTKFIDRKMLVLFNPLLNLSNFESDIVPCNLYIVGLIGGQTENLMHRTTHKSAKEVGFL